MLVKLKLHITFFLSLGNVSNFLEVEQSKSLPVYSDEDK